MSSLTLDVAQWAEQQFGACELGDKRRTKRLVKLGILPGLGSYGLSGRILRVAK